VPGRGEGVRGVPIEAFVEVSVDIEHGPDTRMAQPRGDHGGVDTLLYQKGYVTVAEVRKAHWFANGLRYCWLPDAASEVSGSQVAASGGGEEVLSEDIDEPFRQGDRSDRRTGLRLSDLNDALDIGQGRSA
jgi:hypothetical protein